MQNLEFSPISAHKEAITSYTEWQRHMEEMRDETSERLRAKESRNEQSLLGGHQLTITSALADLTHRVIRGSRTASQIGLQESSDLSGGRVRQHLRLHHGWLQA